MTRGGLSIDKKMVDAFVSSIILKPEDFGKVHSLKHFGFDGLTVDFQKAKALFSTGLCLDLQRMERGPAERFKNSDLGAALKSPNPIDYLRSRGYSERLLSTLVPK